MSGLDSLERLPCGCLIGNVDDAFVIRPCSLLCPSYLYTIAETKRQGKPIETRVEK